MKAASNQKITIYTPDSKLKHPVKLACEMGKDLLASRELAWRLIVRDISAQYRQSFLGVFWAFIPPIVTALGLSFANNAKIFSVGTTDLPYPAYVMFSMSLWQTFVEALNGPIQAVSQAKPMLAKINFPRESIILAKIGEVLFSFGIKLFLIVGLFVWFRIPVSSSLVIAPLALIQLIILGTAIGLLLAPLGALSQDFSRGLSLLTGLWLFMTPVIYPIPEVEGLFSRLIRLNPVTPLIMTTRELATVGIVSNPIGFWWASGIALIGLLLSWLIYRLAMPYVVERISA